MNGYNIFFGYTALPLRCINSNLLQGCLDCFSFPVVCSIQFLSRILLFQNTDIAGINKFQSLYLAESDTLRITVTNVAFNHFSIYAVKAHSAEWTDRHAGSTSDTYLIVYLYSSQSQDRHSCKVHPGTAGKTWEYKVPLPPISQLLCGS